MIKNSQSTPLSQTTFKLEPSFSTSLCREIMKYTKMVKSIIFSLFSSPSPSPSITTSSDLPSSVMVTIGTDKNTGMIQVKKIISIDSADFMGHLSFREICNTVRASFLLGSGFELEKVSGMMDIDYNEEKQEVIMSLESGLCDALTFYELGAFTIERNRVKLMDDISEALQNIHFAGYGHFDVTLKNIVYFPSDLEKHLSPGQLSIKNELEGTFKLIDHEFMIKKHRICTHTYGTPYLQKYQDPKCGFDDLWSLSCIGYTLVMGDLPYYGTNQSIQEQELKNNRSAVEKNLEITRKISSVADYCADMHFGSETKYFSGDDTKRKVERNKRIKKLGENLMVNDVPFEWKSELCKELLCLIGKNEVKLENIILVFINLYKVKHDSLESYRASGYTMLWLSLKLTTNNKTNTHLSVLQDWVDISFSDTCRFPFDHKNQLELTDFCATLMSNIYWTFDEDNVCNVLGDTADVSMNYEFEMRAISSYLDIDMACDEEHHRLYYLTDLSHPKNKQVDVILYALRGSTNCDYDYDCDCECLMKN